VCVAGQARSEGLELGALDRVRAVSWLPPLEPRQGVEPAQAEEWPHSLSGCGAGGLWWPAPLVDTSMSPIQKQIQEEPLDSLMSSVRQQAMETLTQLR